MHLLGVLVLYSFFSRAGPLQALENGAFLSFSLPFRQEKFHERGLRPLPHALYLTVSSFQNNGLVLTPSSVMARRP